MATPTISATPVISTTVTVSNPNELLIEALRTVDRMSGVLNLANAKLFAALGDDVDHRKFDAVFDALRRRFSDASGVHLFIAADNLGIALPPDLCGDAKAEGRS
jgi:hypothetical protein